MKKRILGPLLAMAAAVSAAGAFASACSLPHNDQSIFIHGVLAPQIVEVGSQCTYTADATLAVIGFGTLDAALSQSYTAEILVGNQLVPQSNPAQSIAESNRVSIQGAIVNITGGGLSGNATASYTYLANGFVDPSSGSTPNYGLVPIEIISNAAAQQAIAGLGLGCPQQRLIVAHVKVYGQTLGEQYVESNVIDFPVNVCNGCLVSFPAASIDPLQPAPNCDGSLSSSSGGSTTIIQPCYLGQDQVVDCRLCQGKDACNPAKLVATCQ